MSEKSDSKERKSMHCGPEEPYEMPWMGFAPPQHPYAPYSAMPGGPCPSPMMPPAMNFDPYQMMSQLYRYTQETHMMVSDMHRTCLEMHRLLQEMYKNFMEMPKTPSDDFSGGLG